MGSVGVYLREMRESKGVSLEDMARATRVGRTHLEALEGEDLTELPAPVFVKGFIRAYCQFLDAKPDEALTRYRTLVGEPEVPAGTIAPGRTRPGRPLTPVAVSLVLLAALGGGLLAVHLGGKTGTPRGGTSATAPPPAPTSVPVAAPARTIEPPAPPVTAEPAAAPVAPAPTARQEEPRPAPASSAALAAPAPGPTTGQRLVIKVLETTWLRVKTDTGQTFEETLPAGTVKEWSTETRFVLTVGNAGGLEITLNGQRLPPLGPRGVVIRDLVLPADPAPPQS